MGLNHHSRPRPRTAREMIALVRRGQPSVVVTFFDTAEVYGTVSRTKSSSAKRWQPFRKHVAIATKFWP